MKNIFILISFMVAGFFLIGQTNEESSKGFLMDKVVKSDQDWEICLTPEEYQVLREKGTERAFSGKYYKHKEEGTYVCAGCDNELFSSDTKYDSGSGWPAFFDALDENKVNSKRDITFGMIRTEISCAKCDSHLGHIFEDGPKPTGLRYCVNSLSLNFIAKNSD
jgi:peptide-methionine (R)-S-oxide reductase